MPVELIVSLAENGGAQTAIAILRGVALLPTNIAQGLQSDNPEVQGRAVVDALTRAGFRATAGVNGGVGADVAVATGSPITTRFVNGVTVVDRQTGAVFNGTVDLQPTFDRIAAGATGFSKNDGSVFRNGQGLLPSQSPGYYTEYVVPTLGISGPGPKRIVTGRNGEMFYTPDHHLTFVPVKKP